MSIFSSHHKRAQMVPNWALMIFPHPSWKRTPPSPRLFWHNVSVAEILMLRDSVSWPWPIGQRLSRVLAQMTKCLLSKPSPILEQHLPQGVPKPQDNAKTCMKQYCLGIGYCVFFSTGVFGFVWGYYIWEGSLSCCMGTLFLGGLGGVESVYYALLFWW